jgi:uncharacterized protein (DUF1499 family)
VSSLAPSGSRLVKPLHYAGDAGMAWRIALQAVAGLARTRLVDSSDGYLRAECSSRVLRFVDDLELLIDVANQRIDVRSASRRGWWDFGVNRRRVEALRRSFDAQMARLGKPPAPR